MVLGKCLKVRKKAKIRGPYNQFPHMTQDTIWEGDKKDKKTSHKREPMARSFPVGDHTAARNRQDSMTRNTSEKNPQKKHRLGTARKLLDSLNSFEVLFTQYQSHRFWPTQGVEVFKGSDQTENILPL